MLPMGRGYTLHTNKDNDMANDYGRDEYYYDEHDDAYVEILNDEDDMLLMYMDEEQRRDRLYWDNDTLRLIDESAGLDDYDVAEVMELLDIGPMSFDYLDEPPF